MTQNAKTLGTALKWITDEYFERDTNSYGNKRADEQAYLMTNITIIIMVQGPKNKY